MTARPQASRTCGRAAATAELAAVMGVHRQMAGESRDDVAGAAAGGDSAPVAGGVATSDDLPASLPTRLWRAHPAKLGSRSPPDAHRLSRCLLLACRHCTDERNRR
jgi:hypothetical protein